MAPRQLSSCSWSSCVPRECGHLNSPQRCGKQVDGNVAVGSRVAGICCARSWCNRLTSLAADQRGVGHSEASVILGLSFQQESSGASRHRGLVTRRLSLEVSGASSQFAAPESVSPSQGGGTLSNRVLGGC